MYVLITGHRGFIGGHLVRELKNNGYRLRCADLLDDVDLTEPGIVGRWIDGKTDENRKRGPGQPDALIHLAAQVGRVFGERDLRHTIESNATMTAAIAHECGQRGIPVLYASSSEVYGDQGAAVCIEQGPTVLPHNLYGLTKRWGEEVLRLYAPEGLQIVRLSMPYGPGAPPGVGRRALDNILWQAIHEKPIPIHEGAVRSWCWVEDTVRAIRLVLEEGERSSAGAWPAKGVYNVGRDDEPLSMHELAIRCCALAGACEKLIELVPAPSAQTVVKHLSTDKLRALGWQPRFDLNEGLPQVLDWIRNFDADGAWIEAPS